MQVVINPGRVSGVVAVPPSKSLMQRACAGALLHQGITYIHNPGRSNDDKAALSIIQQLGAQIQGLGGGLLKITSSGKPVAATSIHCGESGLSARMFTAIAALSDRRVRIEGSGSLLRRDMTPFRPIFAALGVDYKDTNGCVPLEVSGPLQPQSFNLSGTSSSQYLTGVLFALSAAATSPLTLTVDHLVSRPYIYLTLDILQSFGRRVMHQDYRIFEINPGIFTKPVEVHIDIEADWSSATSWVAAAAMNGEVTLPDLNTTSAQADKAIIDIVKGMGVAVIPENGALRLRSASLKPFTYDATNSPDLFPVLTVLAAAAEGLSTLKGLSRLTQKESNRAISTQEMLARLGVQYYVSGDDLCIHGRTNFKSATIHSFDDHRIVMAAAIAATRAEGPITITAAEAVSKSYPDFFEHLQSLGLECHINKDS